MAHQSPFITIIIYFYNSYLVERGHIRLCVTTLVIFNLSEIHFFLKRLRFTQRNFWVQCFLVTMLSNRSTDGMLVQNINRNVTRRTPFKRRHIRRNMQLCVEQQS